MNRLLVFSIIVWLCNIAALCFAKSVYDISEGQYHIQYIMLIILICALFVVYSIRYGKTEMFEPSPNIVKFLTLVVMFYCAQFAVVGYLIEGLVRSFDCPFYYLLLKAAIFYVAHITWLLYTWIIPKYREQIVKP